MTPGTLRALHLCLLFDASAALLAAEEPSLAAPQNVRAVFTEKSIDLTWDSVPGATGYHVYTSAEPGVPLTERRRVNQLLVTSGTHFTYIWDISNGQRVRGVKGYRHCIVLTSVARQGSAETQSAPSQEISNCYFEGFSRIETRAAVEKVLRDRQQTARLPVKEDDVERESFVACMTGPVAELQRLVRDTIDPLETGACAPLSTVLVQLLLDCGINAWKVEGTFIKEYHSFVIVAVDGVEYVLDVAADQFVPDVAPVVVPRDLCFLDEDGRLAERGTPVYTVGKVYSAGNSQIVEGEQGDLYRWLLAQTRENLKKKAEAAAKARSSAAKKKPPRKK